ncbi:MAG: phosphoglycerate mutase (2,3-diphosphoglycerate-independent) [Proteobacteria bacterium]|nr:MAG: phosphoglycerate mutase (2,3-diphosphoglycerate-independent) [Pseudomonadota bacterium]
MTPQTAPRRNTILIILDGIGVNPSKQNNAVYEANTPNLDRYFGSHTHTTLHTSGKPVGLPDGQMGNSEVGHLTIGSGTIIKQNLVRIDDAIEDGSFAENTVILAAINAAKAANRPLHLLGLASDGGVHSHLNHLLALIEVCAAHGVTPMVHAFTDGRDTAPKSGAQFIQTIQNCLDKHGGQIATMSGRFYAMDRDERWERIEQAWQAMVYHQGPHFKTAAEAIEAAYADDVTDEFLVPCVIEGAEKIASGDSAIFFNFRNDRPRQMSAALSLKDFEHFDRGEFEAIHLTTMTEYESTLNGPIAFEPEQPETCLAEIVSQAGLKQFHCAETEKYAHVTFFFNGGREECYEGEERKMIKSPNVATYDECPEMSAEEVSDTIVNTLNKKEYSFIVVNFANCDMVGHSAIPGAVIKAVEAVDREVGRVLDAAVENDYSVVLTADHGNCEEYIDPISKEPNTQHTVYPVPCLIIDKNYWTLSSNGGLGNVAPTVLQLMGLEQPKSMRCKSLLLSEIS